MANTNRTRRSRKLDVGEMIKFRFSNAMNKAGDKFRSTIMLDVADGELLYEIGRGNMSRGVRIAIEAYRNMDGQKKSTSD